jgi:hypothetical protein
MNKKKHDTNGIKHTFRPEVTHCLQCGSLLKRHQTISKRMIITFDQIIHVVHRGYRCPKDDCEGKSILYRSMEADALALSGFTFGLDVVLWVGHLRLMEHKTVDEIHQNLLQRFAPLQQTISRREILFLFEAYTSLLRAGTDVAQDEEWKEKARANKGLLLSIDGIQPDAGNETIYLVRDVFTGRILNAENTTESTKERLVQILSPVVALNIPVVGVISDAQLTELQAVAELWPTIPHQVCQFHALRDAGRLIYQADTRARNDMRGNMKEKIQKYRQNLHRHQEKAEQQDPQDEQEVERLHLLDEYAATVEGALQIGSKAPFEYGGLATQEALGQIQHSLEQLKKKEEATKPVNCG